MSNIITWWKSKGKYIGTDIIIGIKNIIKWFPIIWKDRDYDYAYIYNVLEFKLQKQAAYLKEKDRFESTQRSVERMELCVRLIQKIQSEYYGMEHMDYQELEMRTTPIGDHFTIEMEELSENFQEYFDKYPLVYKRVTKTSKYVLDNSSKSNIAHNIAIYNQRRCEALLYEIIHRNINRWWD